MNHQPNSEYLKVQTCCVNLPFEKISQRFQNDLDRHLDAVTIRAIDFFNSEYEQILVICL